METSRLREISGQIHALLAQRQYAQQRETKLRQTLGEVRQRLSLQPEIQTVLDKTQQKLHQQTVGLFEALLTSLNQDVLQGDQAIKLNLEYNRGIPELEIFAQRGTNSEDLWDGVGGALTNIVCTGLRLIALTRTQLRPFLMLDEADNWCMPAAIPRFFDVFEQLAENLSVQTLFITHHDRQLLWDNTRVIRLIREGDETAPAKTDLPVWEPEQPGIRWIHLKQVRLLNDATLHLSPGSNALIGDNGIGKSSVASALRGIAYGEATDGLIRHGADSCQVELGLEHNQVLQWVRVRKGSPKMRWTLLDAAGQVLRESTSAKGIPTWLGEVLGIAKQDKLDIQLLHQKTSVFLLDEPASRQASILSIGQEAAYLPDLMQRYRKMLQDDQQTVKRGEAELGDVLDQLKRTQPAEAWGAELTGLQQRESEIQERQRVTQQAMNQVKFWETNAQIQQSLEQEAALLERLPAALKLQDTTAVTDFLQRWEREQTVAVKPVPVATQAPDFRDLEKLIQTGRDWAIAAKLAAVVPPPAVESMAPLTETAGLVEVGKSWVALEREILELQKSLTETEKLVQQALAELEAAWHAAGRCPLCEHTVEQGNTQ